MSQCTYDSRTSLRGAPKGLDRMIGVTAGEPYTTSVHKVPQVEVTRETVTLNTSETVVFVQESHVPLQIREATERTIGDLNRAISELTAHRNRLQGHLRDLSWQCHVSEQYAGKYHAEHGPLPATPESIVRYINKPGIIREIQPGEVYAVLLLVNAPGIAAKFALKATELEQRIADLPAEHVSTPELAAQMRAEAALIRGRFRRLGNQAADPGLVDRIAREFLKELATYIREDAPHLELTPEFVEYANDHYDANLDMATALRRCGLTVTFVDEQIDLVNAAWARAVELQRETVKS